uniref:Uncharacterized protein n=1 Tax=Oryza punctata TaxID=4537 RepID=A0A0E0M9N2_ORYPU
MVSFSSLSSPSPIQAREWCPNGLRLRPHQTLEESEEGTEPRWGPPPAAPAEEEVRMRKPATATVSRSVVHTGGPNGGQRRRRGTWRWGSGRVRRSGSDGSRGESRRRQARVASSLASILSFAAKERSGSLLVDTSAAVALPVAAAVESHLEQRGGGRELSGGEVEQTGAGQRHPLLRLIRPDSTTPLQFSHQRRGHIPPEMAISVPPVKAAAPMIPPRFQFSHLLLDF